MRLAIVGVAPAPYRDVLFERIANTADVNLRVFYLHSRDSLRGWTRAPLSYPAEFIPSLTPESLYHIPVLGAVNPSLTRRLNAFAPDCILVYGHSFLAQYAAVRWAVKERVPYFLRCDSNSYNIVSSRNGMPSRWRGVKKRVVQRIAAYAAGVLTIGKANDRFWEHYGVPGTKRVFAPFAVDNAWFAQQAQSHHSNREALRCMLELPAGPLLLYAGRFVPAKNLHGLLDAWQKFDGRGVSLVLTGGGPLEDDLRQFVRANALRNVLFRPFQSQSEMPAYYAAASGLILPSLFEPWGLAVNEAMACGLPVFVSERCGCAEDLVESSGNGLLFDPLDSNAIRECLAAFAGFSGEDLARMGRRSREIIEPWNIDRTAAEFLRAFREAAAR